MSKPGRSISLIILKKKKNFLHEKFIQLTLANELII